MEKISDITRNKIKDKSAAALPDNPSEAGYTAEEIKNAFIAPITDVRDSVVAEINRVVGEIDKTIANLDKNSVKLCNVDNTSDADKPISTAMQAAIDNNSNYVALYSANSREHKINWGYPNGIPVPSSSGIDIPVEALFNIRDYQKIMVAYTFYEWVYSSEILISVEPEGNQLGFLTMANLVISEQAFPINMRLRPGITTGGLAIFSKVGDPLLKLAFIGGIKK